AAAARSSCTTAAVRQLIACQVVADLQVVSAARGDGEHGPEYSRLHHRSPRCLGGRLGALDGCTQRRQEQAVRKARCKALELGARLCALPRATERSHSDGLTLLFESRARKVAL